MDKMVYLQAIKAMRDSMNEQERAIFDLNLAGREKNPVLALVLGLHFGTFGLDRFYCGNVGLGILKLLTFGVFGIMAVVDWFLIMDAARRQNFNIATEIKNMIAQHPPVQTPPALPPAAPPAVPAI